ncbi:MAG: hypothetical protein JWR07_743 [Nevskia sp.]|nr:hypothetical protein [Nevskia sp.]
MPHPHDKQVFYKYLSGNVTKLVLESATFQWSAPALFNDPFDHQASYRFDFDEDQAADHLAKALEEIVFGASDPVFEEDKELGRKFAQMRGRIPDQSKDRAIYAMKQSAKASASRLGKYKIDLNATLLGLLSQARVLCVSETHDNVVMWSHYADCHKGVVLELGRFNEVEDNLLAAKPVEYVEQFPLFMSVENWIDYLTGKTRIHDDILYRPAFAKHVDWRYEKEWRVWIPAIGPGWGTTGRTLLSKDRRVFTGLYFGCRVDPEVKAQLLAIAATAYPEMKIYQAHVAADSFQLVFERQFN